MKQKQKILTQTSQVGHMSADVSATVRGVARGESRGDKSPNRRLSGTFYEKNWLCWVVATLFSLPEVFCGLQICQNALAAGAPPPPLGELTTLPQTPSRLGRGHPNPHSPRRLDSRAFGSQLWWPQCKILATPLATGYGTGRSTFETLITSVTDESTWTV